MNDAIYKYPLKLDEIEWIELPIGAKIIHVAEQRGKLFFWAEIDVKEPRRCLRGFYIAGTGLRLLFDFKRHLGSVVMPGGHLVCHVYEVLSKEGTES